ncbi:hypothetical protein BG74_00715 [Sodalis-like endosymbiont of Proechinophthirus fluctus]|nr:hypothetical protein BG74_00715 [Sodalis-like endosymbiont of Proechinophthirus fluctus]
MNGHTLARTGLLRLKTCRFACEFGIVWRICVVAKNFVQSAFAYFELLHHVLVEIIELGREREKKKKQTWNSRIRNRSKRPEVSSLSDGRESKISSFISAELHSEFDRVNTCVLRLKT